MQQYCKRRSGRGCVGARLADASAAPTPSRPAARLPTAGGGCQDLVCTCCGIEISWSRSAG
eukprot:6962641-Pyramimonas_sp.AAC.1